jgi:FkbM family methyltransferase
VNYSQYQEQRYIEAFFAGQPPGRFLDIGAQDGISNSNTRRLYELGWRGVCVEPESTAFLMLCGQYACVEGMQCVRVAVTPRESGEATFYANGAQVATLLESHRRKWEAKGFAFEPVKIQTLSVADLLSAHPGPYEFVTIDAEGLSFEIALAFPFREVGCRLACIESDGDPTAVLAHMAAHGLTRQVYSSDNLLVGLP